MNKFLTSSNTRVNKEKNVNMFRKGQASHHSLRTHGVRTHWGMVNVCKELSTPGLNLKHFYISPKPSLWKKKSSSY